MTATQNIPYIVAHRGSSALAPENTFAAFQRAVDDGAEGIEFDVRLAKDGIPVVFHDSNLKRICGNPTKISDVLSEELCAMDAGTWFNKRNPEMTDPSYGYEKIPSLEQTLNFLNGFSGTIYIELKCGESEAKALSRAICRAIEKSPLLSRIVVKSFELDVIPYVRKRCPGVKTAALFAPKVMTLLRKEERLISISRDLGVDCVSLHYSLATSNLMEKAINVNLPIIIWTADSPRWIKRSLRLGISSIITNNPACLLAKRNDVLLNG